ncbi:MAG: DUF5333 domain-containing protein [Paracoccus sp. (in: a-proteobacteria)]|uniref:DUF5333 domain-containing protein n=1 Tax=Paracoccus sp. TaxID=267 RepID=UPI0040581D3E
MMRVAGISCALALAVTGAAAAVADTRPPLREVRAIDDKMLWVGLALEISDRCPDYDPRKLAGLSYLWSVRSEAHKLGYSDAEIRDYVRSDAEKNRMRARGETYMRARGLDPESDADLCALGAREIERGSQIGAFLKEK